MKFMRQLFMIALFLLLSPMLSAQETKIIYLSGKDAVRTVEWDFYCSDGRKSGEWTKINVPSQWELQGFGNYNYGHDWRNENRTLHKETGTYRHTFEVPRAWKGKTIHIVFEGSMTDTRLKINGKLAGPVHQGAFYRFTYNISKLLEYGKTNTLEAEVAKHSANESVNKAERQADYWIFGGIFRPVYLEVLPETHISHIASDARANGDLNLRLELNDIGRNGSVEIDLFDTDGNKQGNTLTFALEKGQKEVFIQGNFGQVQSWNPEDPVLYDLKIRLFEKDEVVHQLTEKTGFRTVELRKHDGFYVNGEKVVFKGVNRHSFYPETGRALSEENHLEDILLMKEMNMNAVRMSHYPPDKRFLEIADSLGLFVLNEIAGWQDGYDTIVGPKVIRSTVRRDHNHPSVVIWNNGNEGGWDLANEKYFYVHDLQERPVLYPWMLKNGMDLYHYPAFDYAAAKFNNGNDPFMPTEFLHGLYDGGHGAGLDEYWTHYQKSPLHAGGFLWVFSDEAVLRTDKEGTVYDSDGDHAPDGILGPHRQKEGSFFTIKEIWSPVQVEPAVINRSWNGRLRLTNKYIYTNLNACSLTWKATRHHIYDDDEEIIASGEAQGPNAEPGETAQINIETGDWVNEADIFYFSAFDKFGKELYTWSWPVKQPHEKAAEILKEISTSETADISVNEEEKMLNVKVKELQISFSREDGSIVSVMNGNGPVSFSGGPSITGVDMEISGTQWQLTDEGDFILEIQTDHPTRKMKWKLDRQGILMLEADLLNQLRAKFDYFGVSFQYPEEKSKSIRWMGSGPYRVWKNRLKGSTMGFWSKDYNNTITGESFNNLIYPEFKGYHGNLYWAIMETTESPFSIISSTPNLYLQLFTPGKPQNVLGGTHPPFPDGDISFLYEIPAIGTKFKKPFHLGPSGQQGVHSAHKGEETHPIKIWFDFR